MTSDNFLQQVDIRQKRIQSFAFVISVCVCVLFSVGFAVSRLSQFEQLREIGLDEKINPNDAPIASLIRLPGIGFGRAAAIVAYRENFNEQEPNGVAFRDCDDLQKVKGIGPKTAQNVSNWVKFE